MLRHIFKKIYEQESTSMPVNNSLKRELEERIRASAPKRARFPLINLFVAAGTIALVAFLLVPNTKTPNTPLTFGPKIDDWQYTVSEQEESTGRATSSFSGGTLLSPQSAAPMGLSDSALSLEANDLGFAVGGAKDINNFRLDIENNYLPLPTDITYEGLFYDYFFDTGKTEACDELFCPSYKTAVTKDPISGETEYYLSVGLNSGLSEKDFERKPLNLVIVLDISGSMSSPFTEYYYDGEDDGERDDARKIDVAKDAIIALFDHLEPEDRLGIVLFDDDAYVAKPINLIGETDMDALEDHIRELEPKSGTDMSAGMKTATELFDDVTRDASYESRFIFLTDAMPNTGDTSAGGLFDMVEKNAEDGIYTTVIGVGVDFQTELIEQLTKTRGANYFSVHSTDEFEEQLDEEFEFMVTPLVFDLELELETQGWEIEQVYGSPEADKATGELMSVSTLFPSKTENGETRGGVVLLKLKKTNSRGDLHLTTNYEDRSGKGFSNEARVVWPTETPEHFDNTGIRKAVLLARYADLIKNWIIDERQGASTSDPIQREPFVNEDDGIIVPPDLTFLGQWEQTSISLVVSEAYEETFEDFTQYFVDEVAAINDDTLEQEVDILERLLKE